jgi:hypothetical protein
MLKRKWQIGLILFVVVILLACSSGPNREEAAKKRFESMPRLTDSVLVNMISGVSGGSSKTCYAGYVEVLYGTDESSAEVIAFYSQFAQREQWVVDQSLSSDQYLAADSQDDYSFSVTVMAMRGPYELHPSGIDQETIDDALRKFNTVYSLNVVYRPGWRDC